MNISIHNDWVDVEIHPTEDDDSLGNHHIEIGGQPVVALIALSMLSCWIFYIASLVFAK